MANLPETPQWEEGVYQIEVSDPVLGGPDGISNRQAKQLASRTSCLKQKVEKGGTDLAAHIAAADPHTQYAPKTSPTFTGTPTAPTPAASDNSKKLVTTEFVARAIAALAGTAPETLDTLESLAAALGNDPFFSETMEKALSDKQPFDETLNALSGKSVAGLLEYLDLGGIALTVENAVKRSGDVMSGQLSTTSWDSYRIKAGERSFFLRFDGNDFYILKTAAGDPDGSWDDARPLRINAGDGRVFLGANTRIEGNVYAQDAFMQTDGNIYGDCWGGYLSTQINNIRNTANAAWNKANDAQINRVSDIRFTSEHQVGASGIRDYRNGNTVLSGFTNGDGDYSAEGLFWSYIQYWRSGQWITVGRS